MSSIETGASLLRPGKGAILTLHLMDDETGVQMDESSIGVPR
jgi:hypothetical protein